MNDSSHRPARKLECVWVLSGSPEPALPPIINSLPRPDAVIAADGGAALASRLGLTPDLIIGDMDSAPTDVLDNYAASGVPTERYVHERKLETDTELAVLVAASWGARKIFVFGALGARVDHALANVLLLAHPALENVQVKVLEGAAELFVARSGVTTPIEGAVGDTVSVLALTSSARGVTNEGLQYPLKDETLYWGSGRGVSNVIAAQPAHITLSEGLLLVIVTHMEAQRS